MCPLRVFLRLIPVGRLVRPLHSGHFFVDQEIEVTAPLAGRQPPVVLKTEPNEQVALPAGHAHDILYRILGFVVLGQEGQLLYELRIDGAGRTPGKPSMMAISKPWTASRRSQRAMGRDAAGAAPVGGTATRRSVATRWNGVRAISPNGTHCCSSGWMCLKLADDSTASHPIRH
jgi:hypothetical protein